MLNFKKRLFKKVIYVLETFKKKFNSEIHFTLGVEFFFENYLLHILHHIIN